MTKQSNPKRQQWRLKPPGGAQKHLENLFATGEIRGEMTPNECYKRHEIFQSFSLDVFKKNFYATKEKMLGIDDNDEDQKEIGKKIYKLFYMFIDV